MVVSREWEIFFFVQWWKNLSWSGWLLLHDGVSLSLGYIRADWLTGLALTTSRELRPATGVSQWFQDLPPVFLLLCVLPTTQTSQVSLSLFLTQVYHRIRIIFFPFHPGKKKNRRLDHM